MTENQRWQNQEHIIKYRWGNVFLWDLFCNFAPRIEINRYENRNYRCDGQGVHATQDIIDRIAD
jgi:hypothetical protein